jgi:prevent-host-death family protein
MVRMSATEVARNFSAAINRVDAGEEIEIVRNGRPIAELKPPSGPRGLKGDAWRKFVENLPPVDEDFARDVEAAQKEIWPALDQWPAS